MGAAQPPAMSWRCQGVGTRLGVKGVRAEQGGAGGCRAWRHLGIVLRLGTSRTRAIYGARASAWRHNLNGRGGGCRGCSHPAQKGSGMGGAQESPCTDGHQRMLWLDACPRHTPGRSQQRGTERWAMAAGADPRGRIHGHTAGTQPPFPERVQPTPCPSTPRLPAVGAPARAEAAPAQGVREGLSGQGHRPPTAPLPVAAPTLRSHPPLSPQPRSHRCRPGGATAAGQRRWGAAGTCRGPPASAAPPVPLPHPDMRGARLAGGAGPLPTPARREMDVWGSQTVPAAPGGSALAGGGSSLGAHDLVAPAPGAAEPRPAARPPGHEPAGRPPPSRRSDP